MIAYRVRVGIKYTRTQPLPQGQSAYVRTPGVGFFVGPMCPPACCQLTINLRRAAGLSCKKNVSRILTADHAEGMDAEAGASPCYIKRQMLRCRPE